MPRRKRSDHAVSMISKRWCSEKTKDANETESETKTSLNARLLNLSNNEPSTPNHNIEDGQYIIVDTAQLKKLFQTIKCPSCRNNSLILKLGRMQGFATELTVFCKDCCEENSKVMSSIQQDATKDRPQTYIIKSRAAMTDRRTKADKEMADALYQFHVMNIRFAITREIPRFAPRGHQEKIMC
ncbi:hypothetical protein JTE90_014793 [Oedothorax gibbosus]|uniref:Uncharacterized protein n=1 Tax=Oedothorax gibbosus TaxID=931172 RepID=A0AAV6U0X5_9ARAC|nr:hypothetical protein JTE90_014793 [Oedothorax gibbosus]